VSTFADSSALVKLYADEPDAPAIRALEVIVASTLARVEVPAALWRKRRSGELSEADARLLMAEFDADWFGTDDEPPRFVAVAPSSSALESAVSLVVEHDLRAYDAIQLASALAVRDVDPACDAFACADRALRAAARSHGFALLP
jgi:hypothetical protein